MLRTGILERARFGLRKVMASDDQAARGARWGSLGSGVVDPFIPLRYGLQGIDHFFGLVLGELDLEAPDLPLGGDRGVVSDEGQVVLFS